MRPLADSARVRLGRMANVAAAAASDLANVRRLWGVTVGAGGMGRTGLTQLTREARQRQRRGAKWGEARGGGRAAARSRCAADKREIVGASFAGAHSLFGKGVASDAPTGGQYYPTSRGTC